MPYCAGKMRVVALIRGIVIAGNSTRRSTIGRDE
jgi:hypothetical protein